MHICLVTNPTTAFLTLGIRKDKNPKQRIGFSIMKKGKTKIEARKMNGDKI